MAGRNTETEPAFESGRDFISAKGSEGGRVLLHIPSGTYLKLDANSSAIFDLLIDHVDIECASAALSEQFSIDIDRARADVEYVVETLTSLQASRASRPRLPTMDGVKDTAQRWWSFSVALRIAIARVVLVVTIVEIGLRLTDLRRLSQVMRVPLAPDMTEIPRTGVVGAGALSLGEQRYYWATGWVLDRWVFEGTCLRRALVTGYFLRQHHPVLRLGLMRDGHTSHAWVEADGMTFNQTEVTANFVVARTQRSSC